MIVALALAATAVAPSPTPPAVEVREMIRDARAIVASEGEKLWPGFAHAPFELDLIEHDREVLFCRKPTNGFLSIGRDPVTGCTMQTRARVAPEDLAASLDIFPGSLTIMIGLPEKSGKSRADWTATVMHEAFHQYQHTIPGYQAAIDRLDLAGASHSAAWMLDYPFPYDDPKVEAAFAGMDASASAFLDARSPTAVRQAIVRYVHDRQAAQATVSPAAWRYYEFQIGQEGIARWTELALETAGGRRDRAMADAVRARRTELAASPGSITAKGLKSWKREAFYVLGTIEGEMLESMHLPWRQQYRRAPFSIGDQLAQAIGHPQH